MPRFIVFLTLSACLLLPLSGNAQTKDTPTADASAHPKEENVSGADGTTTGPQRYKFVATLDGQAITGGFTVQEGDTPSTEYDVSLSGMGISAKLRKLDDHQGILETENGESSEVALQSCDAGMKDDPECRQ